MMVKVTDEILMQQYAQGDVEAFSELYHRHRSQLYRYFLRQTSTPELAEELYQEVWNKLIKASPRYQVQSKFTTWLYRIAHNELIDYFRRHAYEEKLFSSTVEQIEESSLDNAVDKTLLANKQPAIDEELYAQQQATQLKWCLQQLPREQKEAFLLKHESGLTVHDIALLVGESRESIKSRIRYGLNKLKHCVKYHVGAFYE